MSRDPNRLKVFHLAHAMVLSVFRHAPDFLVSSATFFNNSFSELPYQQRATLWKVVRAARYRSTGTS
jgi:hypothetical protein